MKRLHFLSRLLVFMVIVCMALVFVQPTAAKDKKIVMDISTIGSRTDGSWSQSFYEAYQYIQKKYPEVKVSFSDLNPFAEFPSILEAKAQMGIDIIYVDSAWFEAVQKVAPKYTKTWFIMPNLMAPQLNMVADNVTTYVSKDEQGGFLAGVGAGMLTKTNTIGFVAGMDYPDIIRAGKGFEAGAKFVNPKVKLLVMYTGDWVDVQKGYEAAKAIIEAGADVLMHYNDNAGKGVFKAAKDHHVYVIGEARDQAELAPKLTITSFLVDHPRLAEKALLDFKAGQMRKAVQQFGIEEGWPVIAPVRNVPAEVKAKMEKVAQSIKKGEIKVPLVTDPKALRRLK